MGSSWYILQTHSGYENKIEKEIERLIAPKTKSDEVIPDERKKQKTFPCILGVRVPVEEVTEVKDGKKKTSTRKYLPGYIMVKMDLSDSAWKEACGAIRGISGVSGFLGATGNEKPRPLSTEEATRLLQKSGEIKGEKTRLKQEFVVGEQVKIIDGPFASFTGTIEEVNQEKNKLRVMVGIFGRATPVEVDLLQVEKE